MKNMTKNHGMCCQIENKKRVELGGFVKEEKFITHIDWIDISKGLLQDVECV